MGMCTFNNQQQNNGDFFFKKIISFFLPASFSPNNRHILQSLELSCNILLKRPLCVRVCPLTPLVVLL